MTARKPLIPSPTDRPTEYVTALAAALLALVAVFVNLPEGFETAFIALVGLVAPLVTYVVARRRGEQRADQHV